MRVDPSAVTFLMEKEHLSPSQMDELLNKKSGMLGISGISSDDRDVAAAVEQGNERAKLAWNMRTYQITKYIGGFIAALGEAGRHRVHGRYRRKPGASAQRTAA